MEGEQRPTVNVDSSTTAPARKKLLPKTPLPPLPPNCALADDKHIPKKDRVYWDAEEKIWFKHDWTAELLEESITSRLSGRLFSPANRPDEPPTRFCLGTVGICTPGNLTAISAPPKAGKSAAIGGMIASTFADADKDCLGFYSDNTDGLAVIHFDTEQCPWDHYQSSTRALKRAGLEAAPEWLRSYCVTGFSHKDIREAIRVELDQAAQKFGGIHSFILDGVADAILDVNDAEKSNEFVSELHIMAIKYECPIIGIIHVNPSGDKTRGHLGSQLERKAETNLKLEKDDDEITVIWADKNRRASIPKKSAPCFAWDDTEQMHVTVENPAEAKAEAKDDAKREAMKQEAKAVFAGQENLLRHKDLVSKIEVSQAISNVGAKKKLTKWVLSRIVTKQDSGLYTLTP